VPQQTPGLFDATGPRAKRKNQQKGDSTTTMREIAARKDKRRQKASGSNGSQKGTANRLKVNDKGIRASGSTAGRTRLSLTIEGEVK